MRKFIVAIEETVSEEFNLSADTPEEAMRIAKGKYENGVLIVSPGEVHLRRMAIVNPEDDTTEWHGF